MAKTHKTTIFLLLLIVPRVTERGRLHLEEFGRKEAENNLRPLSIHSSKLDGFERSTAMTSSRTPTVIGQRRWKCYKRCHSQSNKNTFTIVIKNALNFEILLRSFSLAFFPLTRTFWSLRETHPGVVFSLSSLIYLDSRLRFF